MKRHRPAARGSFVGPARPGSPSRIVRVCAAVVRGGSILMVRHRHDGRSYWTLPGGGVETGETPERAAVRELAEETGTATVGFDPEEAGKEPADRMPREVGWHELAAVAHDRQVARVLERLGRP